MHVSRTDLNLFTVFEAIYTEGGITRAAEKLHLSQPAISHSLARLRDAMGDPLFTRNGTAMAPTPRARALIEPVRESLRALAGTLESAGTFDPGTSRRRYTIGIRGALESVFLPSLVAGLAQSAPGISLAAVRLDRHRIAGDLANGLADIAFDVLLPVPDTVRHRRVATDHLVVMARHGHPGLRAPLTLQNYLELGHILVSHRRQGGAVEDMALHRLGHRRNVRVRCQHFFTACRVVAETDLVLTLPARQASVTNRAFGHAIHALPLPGAEMETYLYWHATLDDDAANAWLREQVAHLSGDY